MHRLRRRSVMDSRNNRKKNQTEGAGLQSMAVSNERVCKTKISSEFYLSVHFMCAHEILNLYL